MSKKAPERCAVCGSDSLFSGWFDADDYACDPDDDKPTPEGTRWTTFCNDCGEEWS